MATAQELKDQALAYRGRFMFAEAAEAIHRYLRTNPLDTSMLLMLADTSLMAGYVDEAEKVVLQVHNATPIGLTYTLLARITSARGDLNGAERLVREALRVKPEFATAWQELGVVRKFKPDDAMIAKAQRLLRKPGISPHLEQSLCYMLCKAMNDIRKWDKAWDYADRGGAIERRPYDAEVTNRKLNEQREVFDSEFLAKKPGRGHETTAPIFVVGMPRSGTTLVEAILAATGEITPMGELTLIPQIFTSAISAFERETSVHHHYLWTRTWPDESFGQAAEHYLADCKRRNDGVAPTRFVDKLPGNAFHLGEIALMFPNAHVIRVERDPLDTCVSCFLGRFATGHHYSTRPDWLGHAANVFYSSSEEMAKIVPNPVLHVRYEELVSDPEPQIRRMLDFVGVDWNPACLTPGGSGHKSMTRSKAQIREPIKPRSVGRWKRYKNRIGPLAAALGIPEEEWRARCEEDAPKRAA
ncbi:MAG: sulfotransferase [Pseudomonadota bacterium]